MKKPSLDTILFLLAMMVLVVFFVLSWQDERIVKPITGLPTLHWVLLATASGLIIAAGLLSTPKRTNRAGVLGTLAFVAIYFSTLVWQVLNPPVLSTTLLFVSLGVYFLIQAIKQLLLLRSRGVTKN